MNLDILIITFLFIIIFLAYNSKLATEATADSSEAAVLSNPTIKTGMHCANGVLN